MTDEQDGEYEPSKGDNASPDDDVVEDILENDIDDDDDNINPFNIIFESYDDTDVEFTKEEDR